MNELLQRLTEAVERIAATLEGERHDRRVRAQAEELRRKGY